MLEGKTDLSQQEQILEELMELERRQSNAVKPGDWIKRDRERLLSLRSQLEQLRGNVIKPPLPPQLGKRQTEAGTYIEGVRQPELTPQERKTIVDTPKNTQGSQGQRGK